MSKFEIPLIAAPQTLQITLGEVSYTLTLKWCGAASCWVLDVSDASGNALAQGLAVVTGDDLLAQLAYLGIEGELIVRTDHNTDAVPTFGNLGSTSHIYFETP